MVFDGLFVLDVSLDQDGHAQRVDALRDPGSMLGAAETSVRNWKFHPASRDGKPEPASIDGNFVYRPPNYAVPVPPTDFSPVIPPDRADSRKHSAYVAVGILWFTYPEYPVNSARQGWLG